MGRTSLSDPNGLYFESYHQKKKLKKRKKKSIVTLKNNEDGVTHLADLVDLIIRARRLSAAVEGNNTMVSSTMATTTIKST